MNTAITTIDSTPLLDPKENAKQIFDLLDVSEETRKDYQYRIAQFFAFIKKDGLSRNSFLEYKRYLAGRIDYSVSTKNKYLASAKIFLKELNRQGLLPVDMTQNIKSFTHDKKHKKDGLSQVEIQTLTDALRQLPLTPQNTRLRAIIALLTLQGLRQVEIVRLDVKDIDLVSNKAFIHGKGRDDYILKQ